MSCRGLIAAVTTVAAILSGDAGRTGVRPEQASRTWPRMTWASQRRSGLISLRASGSPTAARSTSSGTRSRSTARSSAARPAARTAIRTTRSPSSDPARPHSGCSRAPPPDAPTDGSGCRTGRTAATSGWPRPLDRHQPVRHRGAHQPAAGEVEGEYTARFTVGAGDALTYQGITALTGAAGDSQWGSATPDPHGRGWWLTGTRNTGGTGCVADCKTMDTAFVPLTAMTHPSAWHVQLGVLPAGEGYDLGTVVSMSHVTGRGWVAYTKRDDITGSTLERLNAWHVTGPWHVATQQWQARPAPGCAWTYSAETHPASPAPPGTMLVSWASNHDDPGPTCDMQPQFTDLPIGSPPPLRRPVRVTASRSRRRARVALPASGWRSRA